MERLLLVAAFAQSAFHAVGKLKPMVPIMGETYEVSPKTFLKLDLVSGDNSTID